MGFSFAKETLQVVNDDFTYQSSVQGDLQSRKLRIESNNKKGSA
jgi:hypothetical protein